MDMSFFNVANANSRINRDDAAAGVGGQRHSSFSGKLRKASTALIAAWLASSSGIAFAQTSTEPAPTEKAPEPQESGIADIVVTATRREERLQDIPVSVTALTVDSLQSTGATEIRNLTQVVPGFNGRRSLGSSTPNIRGIGSNGSSVGDESNVATYVDGIYQPDQYTNFIEFVEVDRVEVLRGPQGTVFGRNATGGLINVITPDPRYEFQGSLSAQVDRTALATTNYRLQGHVTGGLSENVAVDVSGVYRKTADYVQDLVRGGRLGGSHIAVARGKLMSEPSSTAKLILTAEYFERKGSENALQPFEGNTAGRRFPATLILPTKPWQTSTDEIPYLNSTRTSVSLRTYFGLGSLNLETSTAYNASETNQFTDSDSSNIALGRAYSTARPKSVSHEMRLLSTGNSAFKWLLGVYFFHLDGRQQPILESKTNPALAYSTTAFNSHVKTTSYAGFGEGTYQFSDRLFLTLGARYTTEKREFTQVLNGNPLPFGTLEKTFDKFTYRAAIRYNIGDRSNIYASYGTGFKSGLYNTLSTASVPVNPENIKAAEIGFKVDPSTWLRINGSVFYYDYQDLQLNARDATGIGYLLLNAANAEIYGGELEVQAQVNENLSLRGSYAYNHGEYTRFPNAQTFVPLPTGGNSTVAADVSGKQLINAPRNTLNGSFLYSQDLGQGRVSLTSNIFWSDRIYYDSANLVSQKPHTLVTAEVSWTAPGDWLKLRLWGTNLTNAKIYQSVRVGALGNHGAYEEPRRIGIGAEVRF